MRKIKWGFVTAFCVFMIAVGLLGVMVAVFESPIFNAVAYFAIFAFSIILICEAERDE